MATGSASAVRRPVRPPPPRSLYCRPLVPSMSPTEEDAPPMTQVSVLRLRDPVVLAAQRKLLAGERLTQEDGVRLFDAPLLELGRLADAVARDRHGERVYFTVNRQLNPTNVCVLSCRFCDYAKKPGAPGAYTMTKEEILAHVDPEITEIHIVGGLHNKWRFDDYLDIIRWVKEKKPELSVKAY